MSKEGSDQVASAAYVLITPARNEETMIGRTIQSMVRQTAIPLKWVIVDDGSLDATADIVENHLAQHVWIELVRLPKHRDRSFAAKVGAFYAGLERVRGMAYEVVGNLDADVSFDEDYCEFLMRKFAEDIDLGVAGTVFREEGYSSETDSFEGQNHVAGGCQMFRRQCFEEIGGYIPNKAGGVDWIAVTTARMLGWKTQSFRDKSFFHHRSLGTAERGILASSFSYGEKDYYLGGDPVWEMFRVAYRMTKRPYLLGGMALGLGYACGVVRRIDRPVSSDLMRFHRQEQKLKLRAIWRSISKGRRVNSFEVTPT